MISRKIKVPTIEDKTTDPQVPLWFRRYVYRVCEKANREEEGKKPALIITEFEIKKEKSGEEAIEKSSRPVSRRTLGAHI